MSANNGVTGGIVGLISIMSAKKRKEEKEERKKNKSTDIPGGLPGLMEAIRKKHKPNP